MSTEEHQHEQRPVQNVHVVAVIDKSGSMGELAADVRGGYNTYLDELAGDTTANYTITTVLFDHGITMLGVDVPVGSATRLDESNYRPLGNTALNDAIMYALLKFEHDHPDLGSDERAILFVNTDGYENSSREFQFSNVAAKLAANRATGKWTDLFVGTGPEAWDVGRQYGSGTVSLDRSAKGTRSGYRAMTAATRAYAGGADNSETFSVAEATAAAETP